MKTDHPDHKAARVSPPHADAGRIDGPGQSMLDTNLFCNQIISSAQEGIIVYGMDLKYILWNPYMERLSGFAARDVLGRHPLEVFPFLREAGVISRLERALKGETPEPIDFSFHVAENGLNGWASDTSGPLHNSSGDIVGIIGTVRDITDRKRSEQQLQLAHDELELHVAQRTRELQKSHDLLTSLSRQVPGVIFQFQMLPDGSYRMPYASEAIREIYQVSPEDVMENAAPILEHIHPEDYDSVIAVIRESARTLQSAQVEFRIDIPGQGQAWRYASAKPQRMDDGSCLWHGFSTDITERKKLDEELRVNRFQLKEAQRIAHVGSWNWDVATDKVNWSKELYDITGRDPHLPSITSSEQYLLYTQDSQERLYNAVQLALATGESYELELELIRTDGMHRMTIARGEAVHDGSGNVIGLQGTLQDITERKRLEQQLYSARKLESIGQLAGGVAHEVRNPLNAILSVSEALFRETEIESNPVYEPYIQHIRTQVNRLALLMNDLLDLGKPIPPASLHPMRLDRFCAETINFWNSSGVPRDHDVTLEIDPESAQQHVMIDDIKLQQVFYNLIENAAQHSPKGSKIIIRMVAPNSYYANNTMAIVRISDCGEGIPLNKLSRIFDPFYSDRRGGTGLGLTLVKHFIENMGGSIALWNNDPPPGCSAELRIPLADKEQP